MIKSISLDDRLLKAYDTKENKKVLENLSRINIFIGTNNSGKSRFIRSLFANEDLRFSSDEMHIPETNAIIEDFNNELNGYLNKELHNSDEVIQSTSGKIQFIDFAYSSSELNSMVRQHISDTVSFNGPIRSAYNRDEIAIRKDISNIASKYLERYDKVHKNFPIDIKLKKIYIPTLRGMRRVDDPAKDVFLSSTINDYFNDTEYFKNNIITGLKLNEEIKEHLLGSRAQRKQVRDFENFLSQTFFDNKEVNIIPKTKGGVIHFMIGDQEKEIFNFGDGIQSIIILTYPLFFNQEKKLHFFIEEPEHYLHPGFQRIFIETLLLPQFNNYQYFITTHSNHLLDITLDIQQISIYTFERQPVIDGEATFAIENVENESSNILGLIGVRNSSVFLSNSTIWVEGITDRIYLRKYLDIIQKSEKNKFTEDIHYSFVEYGGGNITHWSFLEDQDVEHPNIQVDRLCGKLFLISDNDNAETISPAKKKRHEQLSKRLGSRYYCLKSVEIENILLPEVIKRVVQEYESKNYELKFKDTFNLEAYQNEYLGDFIEKNTENIQRSYADYSGTIKDKVNFAKKAVGYIKNLTDMSEEAISLSKAIYDFIKLQNS